jgi:hypothetical protein
MAVKHLAAGTRHQRIRLWVGIRSPRSAWRISAPAGFQAEYERSIPFTRSNAFGQAEQLNADAATCGGVRRTVARAAATIAASIPEDAADSPASS